MPVNTTVTATTDEGNSPNYVFPLILITSLFFMWGFAYGLLDTLNKHFQDVFHITKLRSTLLQVAYFGGYFLMALPAGVIMKKFGYKRGIILGLCLYALGALLFYPSAIIGNYYFFLISMFILACGLSCLETASNPYVTVLGKRETSEFRLNLSQCFNGVGQFLGPFLAAYLFFGENEFSTSVKANTTSLSSVQYTYVIIGLIVLIIAFLFYKAHLPEINEEQQLREAGNRGSRPLFQNRHFVWGVIAQFSYVAAQVGIAAFFINYATENWTGSTAEVAAKLLGISLVLFTVGRFVGTALMRVIKPNKLLAVYAIINIVLCLYVIYGAGALSVYILMVVFFFESIMFPTIFALGVKDLGEHTRRGGSFMIMAIVGGAAIPPIMGFIADTSSTPMAYWVPLVCFIVVLYYGVNGYRIQDNTRVETLK
ncbi:MAG TPA: L-fucose:H+ symporter permease [Chitinophagaceae bacterium]|jgi:FHS family L-fucose permease-like MFS transporter|nr:L-fucose:H+ symporter permease [Chitinophagaceae bacterium]